MHHTHTQTHTLTPSPIMDRIKIARRALHNKQVKDTLRTNSRSGPLSIESVNTAAAAVVVLTGALLAQANDLARVRTGKKSAYTVNAKDLALAGVIKGIHVPQQLKGGKGVKIQEAAPVPKKSAKKRARDEDEGGASAAAAASPAKQKKAKKAKKAAAAE